jgi:hypothetical protein
MRESFFTRSCGISWLGINTPSHAKERYATANAVNNIYPPDHTAAGPMDKYGAAGAANGNNFAELVCKHFRERITPSTAGNPAGADACKSPFNNS